MPESPEELMAMDDRVLAHRVASLLGWYTDECGIDTESYFTPEGEYVCDLDDYDPCADTEQGRSQNLLLAKLLSIDHFRKVREIEIPSNNRVGYTAFCYEAGEHLKAIVVAAIIKLEFTGSDNNE